MSTEALAPTRYPLGLPAGSVRSILSIMIVGIACAILLLSTAETADKAIAIPAYLAGLLVLMMISFLAAQGRSINRADANEKAPLGLPRWTVRIVIIAGFVATIVYKMMQQPQALNAQMTATFDAFKDDPMNPLRVVLFLLGGYFVGHIFQVIFGLNPQIKIYQDFIAWVSILAMVGTLVLALVTLVINPNLRHESPLDLGMFEGSLSGIIAFYFAVRS